MAQTVASNTNPKVARRCTSNRIIVKTLSKSTSPDRNAQFEFINEQSAAFLQKKCPVISVDAKKKELIGNYKQHGRVWRPKGKPELVNVYDFKDEELGKATPYGIYDIGRNEGYVNVGIDHDILGMWNYTVKPRQNM